MQLDWSKRAEVASMLLEKFPETERTGLSLHDIEAMVRSLETFHDDASPDPRVLQSILWQWMKLADRDNADGEGAAA